jgi:hypothetical protein
MAGGRIGRAQDESEKITMAKRTKRQNQTKAKKKTSRRGKKRNINPQTNQPFEQDSKRRIGPFGGAGEPPIMQ